MTKAQTLVSSIEPDLVQVKDVVALDALQDAVAMGTYAFLNIFPRSDVDPTVEAFNYTIFTDDGVWLVGYKYEGGQASVMVTPAERDLPTSREEAQTLVGRDQACLDLIEANDPAVLLRLRPAQTFVLQTKWGPQMPEDWR